MCVLSEFNEDTIRELFGHEAAEDEKVERLKEYYLKTDVYQKLKSKIQFYLLVGHKGVGKSALLKVLEEEDIAANDIAITIRPDDIEGISEKGISMLKKITIWKEGLADIILEKIQSYLSRSMAQKINVPKSIIDSIRSIISEKAGFSIKKDAAMDLFMNDFFKEKKVCIYIDDLDREWKNTQEDIENLSALLNAVRDLNRIFNTLKFRIGLRSDVYYSVRTSDETTDKIDGSVIWLRWSNHEILVMLIKRINSFLKKDINEQLLLKMEQYKLSFYLDDIFEDTFKGVGQWRNVRMYKVLMSMIRRRPRDLVKLCTLAARKAAEKNHKKIMTDDLKDIFSQYSQDRLRDTCNEYSSELQNIEEFLLNMKPTKKEIKEGHPCKFSRAELISKIKNIQQMVRLNFRGTNVVTPQMVAAFLYKINFITARKETDKGIQRIYYDENRYIYNEFADFGYDFEIHPAYRWALQPDTINDLFDRIQMDENMGK